MPALDFEPWEPEETVGKIWHSFASRLDAPGFHDGAEAELSGLLDRLTVFFRALGGDPSVEIRPATETESRHRLSWRRRIGTAAERVLRPSFDGEVVRLPPTIAEFPEPDLNTGLYFWLTASAAHAVVTATDPDPLRADLCSLRTSHLVTRATLDACRGFGETHARLAGACLSARNTGRLPEQEAAVERVVRTLLGDRAPLDGLSLDILSAIRDGSGIDAMEARRGYRPFRPAPLWLDLRPLAFGAKNEMPSSESDGTSPEPSRKVHRATRKKSEQAERRDSLILHKFEAVLSWAEFLNINRRVDDDDPDSAKKALDDADEIALTQVSKAPATRLKVHLDLAPQDADRERLSAAHTYPEWDVRSGVYLPDHVRVLASDAEPAPGAAAFATDLAARRRIRAVRRQFEALRPRRVMLAGQPDGIELDLEAAVRSAVDLTASGRGSDRIWRDARCESRDLAVSILLDASRSTESAVGERTVIEIAREALAALAWGLDACGDDCAIHAFSSLRRDRVFVLRCKDFDEKMGTETEARIASVRPGFYTRIGAAIRHVSQDLAARERQRRLLLIITDGKPNDLDHYEGRHGIEDTRMAVREARRAGQAVFAVTIDAESRSWFPRIFGNGGFALVPDPDRLTAALPAIYGSLTGA